MSESNLSGITTWRCSLNQSFPQLKCKAKAYTKPIGTVQRVKLSPEEHTHSTAKLPNGRNKKSKIKKINRKKTRKSN